MGHSSKNVDRPRFKSYSTDKPDSCGQVTASLSLSFSSESDSVPPRVRAACTQHEVWPVSLDRLGD